MSDIDFQNGFICGMATKGLVRSGELYKPIIWNDEGVYSYFYIDFRRAMEPFSTGVWNESVVIHDSEQIKATNVSSKMSVNPYVPIIKTLALPSATLSDTVFTDNIHLATTGDDAPPQDVFAVSATASSSYSASFLPSNAIDGNTTTRWASANKSGTQYIQFDFGAEKTIAKVKAMCGAAYVQEVFDVYASMDGTSFSLIGANKAITQADILTSFDVTVTQCRYVKLVMLSTASASFYEMKEFSAETASEIKKYISSGNAVFATTDIQTITDYAASMINWQANEPTGTSVKVYAAIGTTTPLDTDYAECTNLAEIPGIAQHDNLSTKTLYIKAVLNTTDTTKTPSLSALSFEMTDTKYSTFVPAVESGKYKITCDISNRPHGITVMNKKTSRLRFANGESVPVFSIHMFISGQPAYLNLAYKYDSTVFSFCEDCEVTETIEPLALFDFVVIDEVSETASFDVSFSSVSENIHTVVLT